MNDVLYLFFNDNDQETAGSIEKLMPEIDALLNKYGWEYTGLKNMYRPVEGTDPDETFIPAIRAVKEADWLKTYKPFFEIGTWTNVCDMEEIIIQCKRPLDEKKFRRYWEYYKKTKQFAHGIIVDENHVLMDGYMTYLIARKEDRCPDIIQVRRGQRFRKVIEGKYIEGDEQLHEWYYDLEPAVVPGDRITVPEEDGEKQMLVEKVFYVAGRADCEKYRQLRETDALQGINQTSD